MNSTDRHDAPAETANAPVNEFRPFTVYVDDNFHYMDEDERYEQGDYQTYDSALAACMTIVEGSLNNAYESGMTAEALYGSYCAFGEDPWITPTPEGVERFSAWTYAKHRAAEICG